MRYVKYICKSVTCSRRVNGIGLVWYDNNFRRRQHKSQVPDIECPLCGRTLRCRSVQKTMPLRGIRLGSMHARRLAPGFQQRRRKKYQRNLKLKLEQASRWSEDDDPLGMDVEDDDEEYAPPPRFNPRMRLTHGSQRRTFRNLIFHDSTCMKSSGKVQIKPTLGRQDANTAGTMGHAINGGGTLSAWHHGGWPDYSTDRTKSAEWCHLVADCLGGPTIHQNLVAASFSCNTEMLGIENLLMGKTRFKVQVQALCLVPHVAERIIYTVYAKNGDGWQRKIDGKNKHFTAADLDDLRDEVKDWLSSHG